VKYRLAAALAAPALVAACAVPGNATPAPTITVTQTKAPAPEPEPDTPQDDDAIYLGFLASKGIVADPDTTIEVGKSVCNALDDGFEPELLMAVAIDSGFTTDQAAAIIAAAIMTYCPWHEGTVRP